MTKLPVVGFFSQLAAKEINGMKIIKKKNMILKINICTLIIAKKSD
jgi:hypothetical protein